MLLVQMVIQVMLTQAMQEQQEIQEREQHLEIQELMVLQEQEQHLEVQVTQVTQVIRVTQAILHQYLD